MAFHGLKEGASPALQYAIFVTEIHKEHSCKVLDSWSKGL